MSRRNRRRGRSVKKNTNRKNRKETRGKIKSGNSWIYPILYIVGFIILFISFLIHFSNLEDTTNDHINSNLSFLIPLEYVLFIVISFAMVYFIVNYLMKGRTKMMDKIVLLLSFLSISTFYILSFKEGISENGDNAEYMITAKSLVERGGAYRLYTKVEQPNPLASLGLPIMLAPIYYFRGFDFLWMKILVMALGLSVFPLLFLLFRQFHGFSLSAILVIVCFSSPYLLAGSTNIMTETPYLFWSVLALFLLMRYSRKLSFDWRLAVLVLITLSMTYLTRAVGIAIFIAAIIFLILEIPWKNVIKEKSWTDRFSYPAVKKVVFLAAPLLLFGVIWQLRHLQTGGSQAAAFFNTQTFSLFPKNAHTAFSVVSQIIFSDDTFRWANMKFDYYLDELNLKWTLILILILTGIASGLIKKNLLALYTVLIAIILFFANIAVSYDVMTRYLIILIPFLIYFFVLGIFTLFGLVMRIMDSAHVNKIGAVLCMLMLSQILFANFSSNSFYVAEQKTGYVYTAGFENFLKAARWSKYNLDRDSYVLSRKPRIFYLISGLKGRSSTGGRDQYSEAFEKRKLESFKESGATHLVMDGFNYLTYTNIVPIVQNNPEKFIPIFRNGEGEGNCYVFELALD